MYTLPLNNTLYRNLVTGFGNVEIAKRGEAFSGHYYRDGSKQKLNIVASGEYYRINCPFCHIRKIGAQDTRKRLWINHCWGVPDTTGNSRWSLAHCFNENCLDDPRFLQDLRNRLYGDYNFHQRKQIKLIQGRTVQPLDQVVTWPGDCIPLETLQADHPAVQYLAYRGFDAAYIGQRYGVRYCLTPDPRFPHVTNRLVCPIIYRGKMVTWQARYIGEANWKIIPKYYNQNDSHKSAVIYDFDAAKRLPFVVISEGYFDVWRIGAGGTAVLGKTLSETQLRMIKDNWKVAIIALDEDAYYQSEELYRRMAGMLPTVRLRLPPGKDPCDLTHQAFWNLVWDACVAANINLLALR